MNKRTIKGLEDDLLLMTAGREQDRNERGICIEALAAIANSHLNLSQKQMKERARQALVNIGALAKKD